MALHESPEGVTVLEPDAGPQTTSFGPPGELVPALDLGASERYARRAASMSARSVLRSSAARRLAARKTSSFRSMVVRMHKSISGDSVVTA
jgi:hypothetical protein